MAESMKERVGEVVQQAKGAVGKGDSPVATDAEGRVAVVRDALKAFGGGDFDAFVESMDEQVEWEGPKGDNFPGGSTLSGREQIKERFIEDVRRTYVSFGFVPGTWLESEDRDWVVVIGNFEGEGLSGQGELEEPGVMVWEFHQGKVATVRVFADSAAFPEIVTEEQQQEMDRQAEEREKGGDDDSSAQGDDDEEHTDGDRSSSDPEGSGSSGDDPDGDSRTQEQEASEDPGKGSGDEEHDDSGARS